MPLLQAETAMWTCYRVHIKDRAGHDARDVFFDNTGCS